MAYDEKPDGINDILLTLEAIEKIRLPTLTLYMGERLIPFADPNKPPRPPVNLHLSFGGSYSSSTTTTDHHKHYSINSIPDVPTVVHNILNASVMMKRSYLQQNNHEMLGGHEEEIMLIDDNINVATGGGDGGGGYYNKQKYLNEEKDIHTAPLDIDWEVRSASETEHYCKPFTPSNLKAVAVLLIRSVQHLQGLMIISSLPILKTTN